MRNLLSLHIEPHSGINFIVGANGSGKTSLLEAISLLSRGRSFRTPQIRKVISREHRDLTVFGQVSEDGDAVPHRIGIRRTVSGETLAKIDGERKDRLSDLALMLPTVDIESSSFELVDGGPSVRRELLDWGLFHVEHRFLDVWKRYRVALDQRNALLRAGDGPALRQSLPYWDLQLAEYGHALDLLRQDYFWKFSSALSALADRYLGLTSIAVQYHPGWNQPQYPSLADCLQQNRGAELDKGRSLYGPHRADMEIRWEGQPARDICSRGQKKLVIYAVRLTQVIMYQQVKGSSPILLMDDLPAELDKSNIERVSRFLCDYPCQSFITAIDKDIRDSGLLSIFGSHRMFHVEHGQLIHATSTHPERRETTPHV